MHETVVLKADLQKESQSLWFPPTDQALMKLVFASVCGTLIEWYDFFVFGSLASSLASKFYRTGTPDGDLIAWLGAFAVGFLFRPFGAVLFGYMVCSQT